MNDLPVSVYKEEPCEYCRQPSPIDCDCIEFVANYDDILDLRSYIEVAVWLRTKKREDGSFDKIFGETQDIKIMDTGHDIKIKTVSVFIEEKQFAVEQLYYKLGNYPVINRDPNGGIKFGSGVKMVLNWYFDVEYESQEQRNEIFRLFAPNHYGEMLND